MIAPAEASANLARYDGVRYGHRTEDFDDLLSHVRAHPRRGLRRRGQAAHHDRHLRALVRLLRGLLRQGPAGADQDRRRTSAPPSSRSTSSSRPPRRPSPSSSASAPPTRSRCTCPTTSPCRCRWPASRPSRSRAGCPRGCRSASRSPGPAFSREPHPRRRHALEQAIGFEGVPVGMTVREYEPVIGIEIHVQLATRTKMFCGCALSFGEEPNTRTCPVCLAHPGVLPVTNAEAVHFGADDRAGARLRDRRRARSSTARTTSIPTARRRTRSASTTSRSAPRGRLGDVRIHRVHLEEDAAKLVHAGASGRIHGAESSVVDFNRGGTPLVEIVTEPDLRSAAEAAEFGAAAAGDAAADGRLRREHGGGLAADGRERVDPPGRRDRRSAPRPS